MQDEIFLNPTYEKGLLGFSLYFAYLAKYKNEQSYFSKAEECFEQGLGSLNLKDPVKGYIAKSLDYQLSQIGRFVEFATSHNLLNISASEYLLRLDDVLFDLMKSKVKINDFDSASGALAAGYYFLSRAKNGLVLEKQLSYLVNSIYDAALKDDDGDYYWDSPLLYKRIYLGISHGSSLIISFLSSAYEYNIERELCKKALEKAVNFLLKQCRKSGHKGLFPNMIGDKLAPMQFSLCYGDIGIGYALSKAEKILQSEKITSFTTFVLADCLLRSAEDKLTLDGSIFYGASGLGIAFDRVAETSGDSNFTVRANYWYEQIPTFAIHTNDYLGFQTRLEKEEETWNLWNISFGWGILGIGASLMQFLDRSLPSLAPLTFVA
ncbi:MAG TPA: lanthionine synthetase LanC family protein [Cytophaga sp.]|nr:lanthionine synthetase LanC family protein [Cytophaga sp.]